MAGLYGRSKDGSGSVDLFLRAHCGDDLQVDRIGREGGLLKSPALTLGITIQPALFRSGWAKQAHRDRGLHARFLYSVPESIVGSREVLPDPVPEALRIQYREYVSRVLKLEGEGPDQPH